jgi:hypothetical protein
MINAPFDASSRYMIAYSLLAMLVAGGAVLATRYVRYRRAEYRRRYGIGPRRPERRR